MPQPPGAMNAMTPSATKQAPIQATITLMEALAEISAHPYNSSHAPGRSGDVIGAPSSTAVSHRAGE